MDKLVITAGWDDAARLAALIGNEADILTPGDGIIGELEKYPDEINIQSFTTGWITPIVMRTDMAPFDDVRVRTALKLVQDRKIEYRNWFSRRAKWRSTTGFRPVPHRILPRAPTRAGVLKTSRKPRHCWPRRAIADGLEIELATA